MMTFFLAMTSLCLASASAAALKDPPSSFKLQNHSIKEKILDYTQKITETDLLKEFTTILPDLPIVNSCTYPGTCPSSIEAKNCQRCQIGFVKDPHDDTKCKYANEHEKAFLLTSMYDDITLLSLDMKNSTPIMQNGKLAYDQGVDYSFRTNRIFWYNYADKTIYTAPLLNYGDSGKESVLQDDSFYINEITVDWIYNHIYWVDRERNNFYVSNFNGTMKKLLFSDGVSWPGAIVVNPLSGWMYWADNENQCIKRAGLDGSQKEEILATIDIQYPRDLVLDFVENRLYWSQLKDTTTTAIWSSSFDGSDPKIVFPQDQSELTFSSIEHIALFGKYIYVMAWGTQEIYKFNKCNGQELQTVYNSTNALWDIKIYHSTMQPEGENLCSKRIGQCSHFCLPAPSSGSDGSVSTTTCACPDGLYLSSDQRSCVSHI